MGLHPHGICCHIPCTLVALVKATKGDIIIIPPGYGNVTLNPSREETLMKANFVSTAFVSEYAFYEAMHSMS